MKAIFKQYLRIDLKQALFALLAILLVLVAVSELLDKEATSLLDDDQDLIVLGNEPDGVAIGAVYRQFNEQGQLSTVFRSPRVTQYEDRQIVYMEKPVFDVFEDDGTPWHVVSKKGHAATDLEIIYLEEDVDVRRRPPDEPELRMVTDYLELHNKNNFITTPRPVTITRAFSIVNAVGMNAYVDEKRVKLLNDVDGVYATK